MSTNTVKTFDLGDVLSIVPGRLVSPRHIQGVYEILNWMTRDNLFTHQLPRASHECRPWLKRWFPSLAESDEARLDVLITEQGDDGKNADACTAWVKEMSESLGLPMRLDIPRIPQDDHERKLPYDELVEMLGSDEKIILVRSGPRPQQEKNDE